MVTGSVIAGSAGLGTIDLAPAPGILKVIVSGPWCALAARIASRREVTPSAALTTSNIVVTTKEAASVTFTVAVPVMNGAPVLWAVIVRLPTVLSVTVKG